MIVLLYTIMAITKKIRRKKVSKALLKATTIAQVQVLKEGGASYRDIAAMLKIGQDSVAKYLKMKDKTVTELKSVIKRKQLIEDYQIADQARTRLEEGLDKASFRDTVGLWKIARDLQAPRWGGSTSTAIQININATKGDVSIVNDEVEKVEE